VGRPHKDSQDLEQFDLGQVLERHARIQPTDDVAFHYWPTYLRHPRRERLPRLLADTAHLPLADAPTPFTRTAPAAGKQVVKLMVKRLYRATRRDTPGVRSKRYLTCPEWATHAVYRQLVGETAGV